MEILTQEISLMEREMVLESIFMQMAIFMKVNGIKMPNKDVVLSKLPKETFTEVIGKQIINMEKDNISLLTVIITKGIFTKDPDRGKANIFGQIKVVIKVIGRLIKCRVMENIQLLMELLLRAGSKKMNLLDEQNFLNKVKFKFFLM